MTTLRNLALTLTFVFLFVLGMGVSTAYAQSCDASSGGSTTYTCHGDYVSHGGGHSTCYGYVTQEDMNYDTGGEYCTDGSGGGGGGGTPSVTLTATPTSIESGRSSQLSWSSSYVTSCSIDNGVGTVSPNASGSRSVSPSSTTTYTITCQYAAGAIADTATVTVTAAPQPVTAYCTVGPEVAQVGETVQWSAAPSTGDSSGSLTWKRGATFITKICTGGQNYSSLNRDCPQDGHAYGLDGTACTVEGQRCRDSAGCDGHEYTDGEGQQNAHTFYGSVTPYTCTATNTSGATYSYSWSGTDGLTGNTQNVSKAYSTVGTKSGQVTVTASTGGSAVATCSMQVAGDAPTATLTATPSTIARGSSSTLSWSSSNASSCTLNESIGDVSTSGSRSVSPSGKTTYTLVCSAPATSVSGTWQYYDSDTSDYSCPLTDPNKAYSHLPNCPSNPQGQACSSTTLCKINTVNGCSVNTQLYECKGSASSPARSATASATVTVNDPPSVTCTVNDTTVFTGESATYTAHPANGASGPYGWSSLSGSGFGTGATVTRTFTSQGSHNMQVSATGASAVGSCPLVVVTACPGPNVATIDADRTRVNPGETVTLNWTASGISNSCTITGPSGTLHTVNATNCNVPSGNVTTTVSTQSTYTISCESGAVTDSVIVNVNPGYIEF